MKQLQVMIEGSGRHIHITKECLEALFGAGYELEVKKYLSQPGEFASTAKVDVVGPKGTLKGVSILGPCRKFTQVELSFTDARILGINPPIRESGNIASSAPVTLVGPEGTVELKEGAIVAKRHLHITPKDAEEFGIQDREIVQIKVGGERALIFDEVVARVSENYATAVHLDYDEVNAAALFGDNAVGTVLR
ncbi:MAG TPA: phosphate propanoyltransferase [Clostridiales bacterium]|jgi:putative phosphotransacetylase|nr:phosphate propanoyltransferase [Clostridiales bacterium]